MNRARHFGISGAIAFFIALPAFAAAPLAAPKDDFAIETMIQPNKGDLDDIIKRRYLRILVTMNRTNYFINKAEQHGATFEAGRAFQDFLNARQPKGTPRVHVAFIPVARDQLFDALIAGKGDIAAASLTITPERLDRVDFAAPFARGVKEVLVTPVGEAEVGSPEALSGRSVYVRPSSSYFQSLTKLNSQLKAAGKPPVTIIAADERLEDEDILELVSAGIVPAAVVDDYLANFWVGVLPGLRTHPAAAVRSDGQIAWAVRKSSPELRAATDEFAKANAKGTLLGNVIMKRYFQNNQWVKNPGVDEDLARLLAVRDLFKKYGDKYSMGWLLLAAQAYQESQIDQTKVNPTGAVGIMQIKPSTAADNPILINDVDKSADRNIEAGVKYLRFIVDRYYENEPMEKLDKSLFAIASYNAGPARINRLRRMAADQGLDPNVWFGNVEVVAAREIGRETVDYVSNIYKYYVTYRLITETTAEREEVKSSVAQ